MKFAVFIITGAFTILGIILSAISLQLVIAQDIGNVTASNSTQTLSTGNEGKTDLLHNGFFISINKTSGSPLYWDDPFSSCVTIFTCNVINTDGWVDNQSLQLATQNNTNNTWSWISSEEVNVKPKEQYEVLAHMKLNKWATQSHILLEGYNEKSKEWDQIEQCPPGTSGPLEWTEFDCKITIPKDTLAIVVTLNAGWSSNVNAKAETLFDAIHLYKVK